MAGESLVEHALLLGVQALDPEPERRRSHRLGRVEVADRVAFLVVVLVILRDFGRRDAELREERVAVDLAEGFEDGGALQLLQPLVVVRVFGLEPGPERRSALVAGLRIRLARPRPARARLPHRHAFSSPRPAGGRAALRPRRSTRRLPHRERQASGKLWSRSHTARRSSVPGFSATHRPGRIVHGEDPSE